VKLVHDLDEIESAERAVVFLWVEWSMQARQSRAIVEQLVEDWNSKYLESAISAYMLDVSEQSGGYWDAVRGWLRAQLQAVDSLTYGGGGALVWVRCGIIVANSPFAAGAGPTTLLAETKRVFCSGM